MDRFGRTHVAAYLLLFGFAGACKDTSPSPLGIVTNDRLAVGAAEKSYIVVFRKDVKEPRAATRALLTSHGGTMRFLYERALRGFAATLPPSAVNGIRKNPHVLFIQEDRLVTADTAQTLCSGLCTNSPRWGLHVIDQHSPPGALGPWTYSWFHNGSGVVAYIVDSGIDSTHTDFGGRAHNGFDAFGESGQDCYGHGTHVAGTVGSRTYGVAKGVTLRGVRVLDCNGNGSWATVIAGLEWVIADHENQGGMLLPLTPAVANLSLGGSAAEDPDSASALDSAVVNTMQAGVFVAIAAGNDSRDACLDSPARVADAVTVSAAQYTLGSVLKAGYSNYGSCVDIYGPGSNIQSTRLGGGAATMSGTSMATPHVTGAAAIYKSTFGHAAQSVIASWLVTNATANLIGNNPAGTPNLLVYKAPGL